MAFDGFLMAALTKELSDRLTGGHLQKISQPEQDELILAVKNNRQTWRLVLSASPSLPLIYLTDKSKTPYSSQFLYAVKKTFKWCTDLPYLSA